MVNAKRALHRYTLVTVAMTFLLLIAGGLITCAAEQDGTWCDHEQQQIKEALLQYVMTDTSVNGAFLLADRDHVLRLTYERLDPMVVAQGGQCLMTAVFSDGSSQEQKVAFALRWRGPAGTPPPNTNYWRVESAHTRSP